jgi:hypothetical protein
MKDLRLQEVGVLVLVDQYVVEPAADLRGQLPIADQVTPVEQQVVIVQRPVRELALDVCTRPVLSCPRPAALPVVLRWGINSR